MRVKKITLFMSLFLIGLSLEGYAQVTIGSNLTPNAGSLLDLKQYDSGAGNTNSNKGLMLPRVKLDTEIDFDPLVSGLSDPELFAHTGLIVYHVGSVNLCAGVYSWNGKKWQRLMDPCQVQLLCNSVSINGTYDVGVALGSGNTITLNIEVPYLAEGGEYTISTDTQNGMRFYGTGTLTKGTMHITLAGAGAPLSGGVKTVFTITGEFSNSISDPVYCRVEIPADEIPLAQPAILGFGYYAGTYGYHLESSGSKSITGASVNFGTAATSVVKSKPVVLTHNLNIDGLTASNFLNNAGFLSDPDIIIHGYHSHTSNDAVIDTLVSYLERGGILILQDEYGNGSANNISLRLMKKLCPIEAAGISYRQIGTSGGGDVVSISSTVDDEITNGPFGDLRGKGWGMDASTTAAFLGLPTDSIDVYSTGSYFSYSGGAAVNTYANYVTMFKHKRLNLFIVGDGGMNSNPNNYIGDSYSSRIICPFAMDSNYEPIPRRNWGYQGAQTVYNSQLFANIMAWAVKHARSNNLK